MAKKDKKREKKRQKRLEQGYDRGSDPTPGARCSLHLLEKAPDAIGCSDVQNVLLWALHPELGSMPGWVLVRNRPLIHGAVVILVPGLDAGAVRSLRLEAEGAVLRRMRPPKSSPSRTAETIAAELMRVPVKPPKNKRSAPGDDVPAQAAAPPPQVAPSSAPHPQRAEGGWYQSYVQQFSLTEAELRENGYPAVIAPGAGQSVAEVASAGAAEAAEAPSRSSIGTQTDAAVPMVEAGTQTEEEREEAAQEEEREEEEREEAQEDEKRSGGGGGGGAAGGVGGDGGGSGDGRGGGGPGSSELAGGTVGCGGRRVARLLAVDCEMCLAGETKQLARLAVVDEALQPLLHEV